MSNIPHQHPGEQIRQLGNAHGGERFWIEVLRSDTYPSNICKALLYMSYCRVRGQERYVMAKLHHPSSRVRAWAAFAVRRLQIRRGLPWLRNLLYDPSPRVRFRAREAIRFLTGSRYRHQRHSGLHTSLPTILISDDSETLHRLIDRFLGRPPHLAYAVTRDETIKLARTIRPKLIITDNQKGRDNSSGLRMTRQVAEDDDLQECILIMHSADPFEGIFLWEGGDFFFWKGGPSLTNLSRIVHDLFRTYRGPHHAHGWAA